MQTPIKQLPSLEQLQGWTQLWEESQQYQTCQRVFISKAGQDEALEEAKKITNTQRAEVIETLALEHIITLKEELGSAFEALGLEPPWSEQNIASGLYRTDDHAVPLAIRFLDRLRLSKSYGYVDFRVPGYIYGCPSPISRLRLAKKNGQIDAHIYDEYLANCIDELTKRLFNILANEAISDLDQAYLKDTIRNQLKTLYVEIDQNIAEKTYEFKEDFMDEDFQEFGYFEILGDIQYEFENAESLVEIDQYVAEMTSEFVADFMDEDFGDTILSDHQSRDGMEQDITDLFKRFNLERNAQRHLSDCFDLAFCAKASESDQSAARLQTLKERGVLKIAGVRPHVSVDNARELCALDKYGLDVLIATAENAVMSPSYGLLAATLQTLEKKNFYMQEETWIAMVEDALRGDDPAVIRQCLRMENKAKKRFITTVKHEKLAELIQSAGGVELRGIRSKDDKTKMISDYANIDGSYDSLTRSKRKRDQDDEAIGTEKSAKTRGIFPLQFFPDYSDAESSHDENPTVLPVLSP